MMFSRSKWAAITAMVLYTPAITVADGQSSTSDEVMVAITDWPTIEASLAEHPIAVVDLWSLSCEPCLKEFPHLVELANQPPTEPDGQTIACIGVSVDYDGRRRRPPATYVERVTAFLRSVDAAAITNHVCATPSDDVLTKIDAASIPTVLIYRRGTLVHKFVDAGPTAGFTYASDVIPAIKAMRRD